MTAVMDPQRTLRLSPQVLIGGYVNGRKGAVICLSNIVAHLNEHKWLAALEPVADVYLWRPQDLRSGAIAAVLQRNRGSR